MKRRSEKTLWLDPIPSSLREQAIAAIKEGDTIGFLIKASNEDALPLVFHNISFLKEIDVYEKVLLDAWVSTRTNHAVHSLGILRLMFKIADRHKLLSAGHPLPKQDSFVAYRGVSGNGPARRVRGFSWSASIDKAQWFANRYAFLGDPAVFEVKFTRDAVLAYNNERKEGEFILWPDGLKPKRVVTKTAPYGKR